MRKLLADPCSYAALAGRRDTRRQTVDRQSVTDTPGHQLVGLRGSPPDTWFLGRTQVHVSNGTSIGSSVFVGFAVVTDNRLTDRPTRRQTERQTKRQASRGTDRQTDRQTDGHSWPPAGPRVSPVASPAASPSSGVWFRVGFKNHVLVGARIPPGKGAVWGTSKLAP